MHSSWEPYSNGQDQWSLELEGSALQPQMNVLST